MRVDEAAGDAQRLPSRYRVHELLGRGGMACVYRATDQIAGRDVALKQMLAPKNASDREAVDALFEREYHVLAQLSHPRVIAVYDYGRDSSDLPYYTMELLDGGDLRDRSPLPWREACHWLFDVCSSLALLHSRRLIHRDLSPRNVRCTRGGSAKLIDFGAMVAMGAGGAQIVGTPAFTAPETVHRSALDGRTDLFSLGAVLYYAITGQLAYPARTFAEVLTSWSIKPVPLSARVSEVPVELDDLVLSLLSVEPSLRPANSFEVMQRLAAIAGLDTTESEGVARAYLCSPSLAGREAVMARLRREVQHARVGRGGGLLVRGERGAGRSRILDACALEAETLGALPIRATVSSAAPFRVALDLVEHLLEAAPDGPPYEQFPELFERGAASEGAPAGERWRLKVPADLPADAEPMRQSLTRILVEASRAQPLVIAVDDVERIDEPSAAVLAALVDKSQRGRVFVALTAPSGEDESRALLTLARRCDELQLAPLDRQETHALVTSLFGDVSNLDPVADEIYRLSHGNPRQCMDLAQHLVDQRVVTYAAGVWTLPAKLPPNALPKTAEEAMRARIRALSPSARALAEAHALAFHDSLVRADYRALMSGRETHEVDAAISELVTAQLIASHGATYSIAHQAWKELLAAELDPAERRAHHAALARVHEGKSTNGTIYHLFAAGLHEQGLDRLLVRQRQYEEHFDYRSVLELGVSTLGPTYELALAHATRVGRPAHELNELRRWFVAMSVMADPRYYWQTAPLWLAQLVHDSGLGLYRADRETQDPGQRLMRALQGAFERHQATPEHERVYPVDQAIRLLAEYVAFSIAVSVRTGDIALIETLPPLLEPFAPLSPLLDALWQNSLASLESGRDCHYEQACDRWRKVLDKLAGVTAVEAQHVEQIRNAIACGIGVTEASFGIAAAADWATQLDSDPSQRLSAIYLRKLVRFEQGDWSGADKLRRQAEIFALQAQAPQMWDFTLTVEITSHSHALNLPGLKQVIDRLTRLDAEYACWRPYLLDAQARYQLISGDANAAKLLFERAIAAAALDEREQSTHFATWIGAHAGLVESLLALQDPSEARKIGAGALAVCERRGVGGQTFDLARQLALAEASLGEHARAVQRVEGILARQTAMGVTGLRLGLSYEALARIAIWTEDLVTFQRYARLTAGEYHFADHCPLGVRYARLIAEARRRGVHALAELDQVEQETLVAGAATELEDVQSLVMSAMFGAGRTEARASSALSLVCSANAARGGHLLLVRGQALEVFASEGEPSAPASLPALASEFLARERERSETMTMVETGTALEATQDALGSTVQAAGVTYELLMLSCVIAGAAHCVGVIALAPGPQPARNAKQGQLLSMLAAHFVQAGDCA